MFETRKYRCWKGIEGIEVLGKREVGNIGFGRWERRKYRYWKVGKKEI